MLRELLGATERERLGRAHQPERAESERGGGEPDGASKTQSARSTRPARK
jgi:hypothetical protein